MELKNLLEKYSKSGPRYTSYPTAPQWVEQASQDLEQELERVRGERVSLYVHVPFCESLCYYCGCNIKITKNHSESRPYLQALRNEVARIRERLPENISVCHLSLGGGTPTFLTCEELQELHRALAEQFAFLPDAEVSLEVDPRVTTEEQLQTLRELGWNRVSLGVQDFDPTVQKAVHRIQSPDATAQMLQQCQELGFSGINFDLIYGLPHQTPQSFARTLEQVVAMGPDRIALYNYAHLPSLRPHQKILSSQPFPDVAARMTIFLQALEQLASAGYRTIGMDHFAKETDTLYAASLDGRLFRNFMGYTVQHSPLLLGIGASSISELEGAYYQNHREVASYQQALSQSPFATFRGCRLTADDQERKWIIQSLMCHFRLDFETFATRFGKPFPETYGEVFPALRGFEADGLVELGPEGFSVTPLGRLFVRNLAMVFDAYLQRPGSATYSRTL